jgi:hypothetical protein
MSAGKEKTNTVGLQDCNLVTMKRRSRNPQTIRLFGMDTNGLRMQDFQSNNVDLSVKQRSPIEHQSISEGFCKSRGQLEQVTQYMAKVTR